MDEQVEAPPFHPRWGWALAGTLAVLILGLVVFLRTDTETPEPERVVDAPRVEATSTAPPVAEPSTPAEVERAPDPEPAPDAEAQVEDMVVKIMTDNPDIVIYWLVEQNGG
jgi:hypothetical protein